jgi:hypothetical protein
MRYIDQEFHRRGTGEVCMSGNILYRNISNVSMWWKRSPCLVGVQIFFWRRTDLFKLTLSHFYKCCTVLRTPLHDDSAA